MLTLQADIATQVVGELGEVPELVQPGRLVVVVGQPQFPNERLVVSVAFRSADGVVTLLAQHVIEPSRDVMFDVPLPKERPC
jgi:5,10-methylene-tetrahydrofolate dehydrogenase/methenyl tetrahydrofolate cyclohydrolase